MEPYIVCHFYTLQTSAHSHHTLYYRQLFQFKDTDIDTEHPYQIQERGLYRGDVGSDGHIGL